MQDWCFRQPACNLLLDDRSSEKLWWILEFRVQISTKFGCHRTSTRLIWAPELQCCWCHPLPWNTSRLKFRSVFLIWQKSCSLKKCLPLHIQDLYLIYFKNWAHLLARRYWKRLVNINVFLVHYVIKKHHPNRCNKYCQILFSFYFKLN